MLVLRLLVAPPLLILQRVSLVTEGLIVHLLLLMQVKGVALREITSKLFRRGQARIGWQRCAGQ